MSRIVNRPEEAIQIGVIDHLRARSMPGVFWFHVPNGQKLPVHIKAIRKRMGVVPGVPDLILFYRQQIFGLELKSARGKVSPEQLAVLNAMEVTGARTHVAYSLDEAITALEFWGVLRRSEKFGISDGKSERELVNV